jgi:hypothetical protein
MSTLKIGQMARTRIRAWSADKNDRYAYGIILRLRNKTGIAYMRFLPLEKLDDCWVDVCNVTPVD